jgi:TolB protein
MSMSRRLGPRRIASILLAAGGLALAGSSEAGLRGGPGAVLFNSDVGIFVVNADGTNATRLTRDQFDGVPLWSPDDSRIAFDRIEGINHYGVWVVGASGRGLRRVGTGEDPAWSPDGAKLAYDVPKGVDSYAVVVGSPDGGSVRRLATGWGPDWSPDGTEIAYASSVPGYALGVVRPDGSASLQVSGDDAVDWEWSPAGRVLAFALDKDTGIYILDVATGVTTTLARANAPVDWVDWSPDGSELAIEAGGAVDLVDAASGRLTVLSRKGSSPYWSPDGSRIAFTVDQGSFEQQLLTIRPDGSGRRVIASGINCRSFGLPFDWAGDGMSLVFEKQRTAGAGCDLWRADPDGRNERPITRAYPSGGDFTDPYWASTTIPRPTQARLPVVTLPTAELLKTKQSIYDFAGDAGYAAVVTGSGLGPVSIWTRGASLRKLAGSTVDYDRMQLVMAGNRAAWTEDSGGAPPTYYLAVGTAAGKTAPVDSMYAGDGGLGNLAGDDGLLVYNTWQDGATEKLWRIDGAGKTLIARGVKAGDVVAVDAGRIATRRADGTTAILNRAGKTLSTFKVPTVSRDDEGKPIVRLAGSRLLVLVGNVLDVRDTENGSLERHWRLADADGPLSLEGAQGNLVVYTEGIAVHLLRLTDGRDVLLNLPGEEGPAYAALEPDGLYYSYNQRRSTTRGRVGFVSSAALRRLLGKS